MPETEPLPHLLTIEQLAEHLGVTQRHVRRLVAEKRVPYLKWRRFIRFDPLRGYPRKGSYVRGRVMGLAFGGEEFGLVTVSAG